MTQQEEKAIIEKVIGGDNNAFEALVLANQNNVYNLALKMMRNPEDALDISQEAFIKAYRNLKAFRFDARFSVWLYRLTYNLCIDAIRKSKTDRTSMAQTLSLDVENDEGENRAIEIPDMRNQPEEIAQQNETRRMITESIDELPKNHREILVMREITGMNYEEIAETLGIESGTVKSRLSRARLKLAKILINKGTIPEGIRQKSEKGGVAE